MSAQSSSVDRDSYLTTLLVRRIRKAIRHILEAVINRHVELYNSKVQYEEG